jgi:hypothetical protein
MSTDTIRPSSEGNNESEIEESSALGGEENMAGTGTMAEEDEDNISETDMEEIIQSANHERHPSAASKVVRLLPIHAVPGQTKVARRVGRPKAVERKPNETDLEYHAIMSEQRDKFIASSSIVDAVKKHVDSADMLRLIKEQLASEAAALEWQRNENAKYGKDTAQVSSRRIEALKKMADLEVDIKKMGADTVNLKSEKFQRVFKYLIGSFREVCLDIGMPPEQLDLLFNRLASSMEGWEDKAAELVR